MTDRSHPFGARSSKDLIALLLEQPLGWIVSGAGDEFRASLMPMRPWRSENGRLVQIAGHLPRWNDQVDLLRHSPRAHLLFLGPNAYISGSWISDRQWAPTWNFASARIDVEIEFRDDPEELRVILEDLVKAMEGDCQDAWRIEDMGVRYAELSKRIIGFVAHVVNVEERFKLGQDERPKIFEQILEGLDKSGDISLKCWMERFSKRV